MTKEELYLKTIFCCIAYDGDIATEEIEMVRSLCVEDELFRNIESEKLLNSWIVEINEHGGSFLQSYLKEINTVELNEKEQLMLISFAIEAIEADNRIEYAEVKFFKKYAPDSQLVMKLYWQNIQTKKIFFCLILT
ncbi:MAG: TerB family tellurite resistance protein [Paludibacteraceae bacterium]